MLEQIGLKFAVCESAYEEDMNALEDPYELVKFLARKKGEDVARHYNDAIIISADTFIICDGVFIGKPKTRDEAREILKKFSGHEHEAVSGYAIINTKTGKIINDFGSARVKFRKLSNDEIEGYIDTGEPFDKAGGYGLQDKAAVLIEGILGDFYSIIGLPLSKVYVGLREMGVKIF